MFFIKDFSFEIECSDTGNTIVGRKKKNKLLFYISDGLSMHDVMLTQKEIKNLIEFLKDAKKELNKEPFDN